MKKLLVILCFFWAAGLYAAETCSANALPTCIAIDSATSGAGYTSATINTFGHRNLGVQVTGTAGTAAIINIDCRASSSAAEWFTCATVTNPSGPDANTVGGSYISLPRAYQYRVNIPASTFTAGTVSAFFERYNQ